MNPPRLKRNGTLVICFKICGFRRTVFRGRLTVAHNGTMLYAGQELELLNLKTYTNVDSR